MAEQVHTSIAADRTGVVARFLRAVSVTIRGKIMLAFCALAAITGFLGFYGVHSVVGAGRLVVETYDKPLMSINYSQLALSNFTAMQLALSDRVATNDPAQRKALDKRIDELAASNAEALSVAEERSLSPRAAAAAHATAAAVANWNALRAQIIGGQNDGASRNRLMALARTIDDDFDNLVELTAEDGFKYRESALASIELYRRLSIAATLAAILLGGGVALFLARRMVRPIADASRAAHRIAQGELDVEIASQSSDELGELLGSMAVMRDNIRSMMEREITARQSAQMRLVNAIESTAEGVVLVGASNEILIFNSQVAAFFPEAHFEDGSTLPEAVVAALADPSGEVCVTGGRWLRLSNSPTADGGFVVIVSDITVLKERERALNDAKDKAEAASRSKTEFLSNMGHELRTPLNAVIGFSEIIAGEMMGPVGQPSYKEFANDILRSGHHLLAVINDILDFAKSEGNRLEVMPEPVEPAPVFERMTEEYAKDAERGQLSFAIDVQEEPLWALVDPARIRRILQHLISNAIKFTPAGGRITLAARREGAERIVISVSDTGIGMRPEDIPLALSPFSQVDGGLSRQYEGTGMGLPLCKVLTELHGGRLTIDTEPGKGTTVSVELPEAVRAPQSAVTAAV